MGRSLPSVPRLRRPQFIAKTQTSDFRKNSDPQSIYMMSWDTYVLTMPNQLHALGISVCLSVWQRDSDHKVGYLNTSSSMVEPQSSNSKVSRSFNPGVSFRQEINSLQVFINFHDDSSYCFELAIKSFPVPVNERNHNGLVI